MANHIHHHYAPHYHSHLINCTHIAPQDLWIDPARVTALLARWTAGENIGPTSKGDGSGYLIFYTKLSMVGKGIIIKHNMKLRQIGQTTSSMDRRFPLKLLVNMLAFVEALLAGMYV